MEKNRLETSLTLMRSLWLRLLKTLRRISSGINSNILQRLRGLNEGKESFRFNESKEWPNKAKIDLLWNTKIEKKVRTSCECLSVPVTVTTPDLMDHFKSTTAVT